MKKKSNKPKENKTSKRSTKEANKKAKNNNATIKLGDKTFNVTEILNKIEPYLKGTNKKLESTRELADKKGKEIANYVKKHPIESVSIAFLAGFFLGNIKR